MGQKGDPTTLLSINNLDARHASVQQERGVVLVKVSLGKVASFQTPPEGMKEGMETMHAKAFWRSFLRALGGPINNSCGAKNNHHFSISNSLWG